MKLLFVYHDRADYYGGPIVNARRLLPELRRRGHDVHCFMLQKGRASTHVEALEREGVRCHIHPLESCTEDQVAAMLRLLQETGAEVFIPNLSIAGFYAARRVREAGIPTIAVCRNDDAFHHAVVAQFVTGDPVWSLSGLVCVSQGLYDHVRAQAPARTRLCVIPSGVPIPAACSPQTGPLKLVYVGRLEERQKRILDVVDALAAAVRAVPGTRATLIGEGRARAAVEQRIAALEMHDAIRVAGTVAADAIHDELARHDVIVLLSDYEGTPGAVMDGMAAGLVPVCLDIPGGVRELVMDGGTGLLVGERGEPFVAAVRRLAQDEALRRQLAAAARAYIATQYSLPLAADRWEAFCAELLQEAGERRPVAIPARFDLPPPRSEFGSQDRRRAPLPRRAAAALRRAARRLIGGADTA